MVVQLMKVLLLVEGEDIKNSFFKLQMLVLPKQFLWGMAELLVLLETMMVVLVATQPLVFL